MGGGMQGMGMGMNPGMGGYTGGMGMNPAYHNPYAAQGAMGQGMMPQPCGGAAAATPPGSAFNFVGGGMGGGMGQAAAPNPFSGMGQPAAAPAPNDSAFNFVMDEMKGANR